MENNMTKRTCKNCAYSFNRCWNGIYSTTEWISYCKRFPPIPICKFDSTCDADKFEYVFPRVLDDMSCGEWKWRESYHNDEI